jgi:hypothetical protein
MYIIHVNVVPIYLAYSMKPQDFCKNVTEFHKGKCLMELHEFILLLLVYGKNYEYVHV